MLIPDSDKRRHFNQFYRTAATKQAGRYSITGVDPGSYRIYRLGQRRIRRLDGLGVLQPFKSKGKALRIERQPRELGTQGDRLSR